MGHDVVEVVAGNETVLVEVSLAEHMVDLVLSQVLSQLLSNFLQLVSCYLTLSNPIITDRLTSKDPQTFSISARLSLSLILAVASLKNSAKSIPPD